jgi:hypothetical protein
MKKRGEIECRLLELIFDTFGTDGIKCTVLAVLETSGMVSAC